MFYLNKSLKIPFNTVYSNCRFHKNLQCLLYLLSSFSFFLVLSTEPIHECMHSLQTFLFIEIN